MCLMRSERSARNIRRVRQQPPPESRRQQRCAGSPRTPHNRLPWPIHLRAMSLVPPEGRAEQQGACEGENLHSVSCCDETGTWAHNYDAEVAGREPQLCTEDYVGPVDGIMESIASVSASANSRGVRSRSLRAVPLACQIGPRRHRATTGTAGRTAHEARERGGGHAAARLSVLARSAITPYTRSTPIEFPIQR